MGISSSEFIKGYTKRIICSYLFEHRDCLYNIVKQINIDGKGIIKIIKPSALIVMKQLEEELVSSTIELSNQNQARKYYFLTEKGRIFYLDIKDSYLKSLEILMNMVGGNKDGQ